MTTWTYYQGFSPRLATRQEPCGSRLPSIGRCITSRRTPSPRLCPRQLCPYRHKESSLLKPPAALATADAFGQEPSLGTSFRHRLQQARQALSSPHDKDIAAVAFPALVGLALEPVVNAFNAGLVGHLGTHQLSAVSLGTVALNSCTFLFSFLLFLTVPEIAAAVVKEDDEEVSRVTAHSLWVALGCGLATAVAVGLGASNIVAALKPPEPAVAAQATQYILIRSLAIPAVLLGFVATAVFRGFKDTRTPLLGTGTSVAVSFCLHVLLLNVLSLDVVGAAAAAALASVSSCCVMVGLLIRRGKLRLRHLASPPPLSVVLPILQRGLVLGARNMVSFGMILFASTLCVRMGSAFQASFEVIRQMWMLTMPFFECLNVATQSLCATALGQQDRATARSLLNRLLLLGVFVGAVAGGAVWVMHQPLIAFFTRDPQVVAHVLTALPLVCIFFPLDAAGSIMDGSLMAAKQSNYMSAVQIAGSAVQYVILMGIAGTGVVDTLSIWFPIKVMAVTRILGGVLGVFVLRSSAYRLDPPSPSLPSTATVTIPTTNGHRPTAITSGIDDIRGNSHRNAHSTALAAMTTTTSVTAVSSNGSSGNGSDESCAAACSNSSLNGSNGVMESSSPATAAAATSSMEGSHKLSSSPSSPAEQSAAAWVAPPPPVLASAPGG